MTKQPPRSDADLWTDLQAAVALAADTNYARLPAFRALAGRARRSGLGDEVRSALRKKLRADRAWARAAAELIIADRTASKADLRRASAHTDPRTVRLLFQRSDLSDHELGTWLSQDGLALSNQIHRNANNPAVRKGVDRMFRLLLDATRPRPLAVESIAWHPGIEEGTIRVLARDYWTPTVQMALVLRPLARTIPDIEQKLRQSRARRVAIEFLADAAGMEYDRRVRRAFQQKNIQSITLEKILEHPPNGVRTLTPETVAWMLTVADEDDVRLEIQAELSTLLPGSASAPLSRKRR